MFISLLFSAESCINNVDIKTQVWVLFVLFNLFLFDILFNFLML